MQQMPAPGEDDLARPLRKACEGASADRRSALEMPLLIALHLPAKEDPLGISAESWNPRSNFILG